MTPAPSNSASPNDSLAGVIGNDLLLGIAGKVCNACKTEKPLEYFSPSKLGKFGVAGRCRECRAAILKNDPNQSSRSKKHYEAKRPEILERAKANYAGNPEPLKQKARAQYKKDPKKAAARNAEWRGSHPEKVTAMRRKANKTAAASLSDGYVRANLTKRSSLSAEDIPQDLVELKRVHLKLKRTLKDTPQ